MDLEHLPQRFYEELRSTGAVTTGVTETCGNGEEREEHKMDPTSRSVWQSEEDLPELERAEVAAVSLVRIRVMQRPG